MRRAFLAGMTCKALTLASLTVWAQTCLVCGEIRSIREVNTGGRQAAAGAVGTPPTDLNTGPTGPVVGTVAQFSFQRGAGRGEGWSFGSAGTPEMQQRLGETSYEVTLVMDSGEKRTLQRKDGSRFHVGQRVALRAGELEPM